MNNCGFNAENVMESIKRIIEKFSFIKAYAEEVEPKKDEDTTTKEDVDVKTGSTINYEDLIAKARKEEKEKQYKTINKLKEQVETLTKQHNDDLLRVASLEKDLETANKKLTSINSGDSEVEKELKNTVKTLEKEKEELSEKVKKLEENKPVSREEVEKEVRAELESEYEVKTYKAEKMAELKDDILVPELVMGTTKEEIDASIQSALERSAEIKKNLGYSEKKKRTPKSPSNPVIDGVQSKEISMDYLATLDVGSKEYMEVRKQLGLK